MQPTQFLCLTCNQVNDRGKVSSRPGNSGLKDGKKLQDAANAGELALHSGLAVWPGFDEQIAVCTLIWRLCSSVPTVTQCCKPK